MLENLIFRVKRSSSTWDPFLQPLIDYSRKKAQMWTMKYELRTWNANGEQIVMERYRISTLLSPHSIKFSLRATFQSAPLPFSAMSNINIVINNIQEYRKKEDAKKTYLFAS